jgi:hypothetical protein
MRVQNSVIAPHILIKANDPPDHNKAESALQQIASKPNGRSLIAEIAKLSTKGRTMTISVVGKHVDTSARPHLTAQQAIARGVKDSEFNRDNNNAALKLASKNGFQKGEGTSGQALTSTPSNTSM